MMTHVAYTVLLSVLHLALFYYSFLPRNLCRRRGLADKWNRFICAYYNFTWTSTYLTNCGVPTAHSDIEYIKRIRWFTCTSTKQESINKNNFKLWLYSCFDEVIHIQEYIHIHIHLCLNMNSSILPSCVQIACFLVWEIGPSIDIVSRLLSILLLRWLRKSLFSCFENHRQLT